MAKRFELGQTVVTATIDGRMKSDKNFKDFIFKSLEKYTSCDWGDTCDEDKQLNDASVRDGERILAVYIYPKTGEKIWIITEWDRSSTTVLFPNEY